MSHGSYVPTTYSIKDKVVFASDKHGNVQIGDNMFRRHDISLHLLDVNVESGLVEIEICVQGAKHVGIYRTQMVLNSPSCLLADIKKATDNLLDQQGPFKRVGNLIAKKGSVGGITFGKDPDSLVRWLNRVWRDE